jgi:hypothetical protein
MDLALVLLHVEEMHRHTRLEVDRLFDRTREHNQRPMVMKLRRLKEAQDDQTLSEVLGTTGSEEARKEQDEKLRRLKEAQELDREEIEKQRLLAEAAQRDLQKAEEASADSELKEKQAETLRRCFGDKGVIPWVGDLGFGPMTNMNRAR